MCYCNLHTESLAHLAELLQGDQKCHLIYQCCIMLPELVLDFYEQSWKLIITSFNPHRSGSPSLGGRSCLKGHAVILGYNP